MNYDVSVYSYNDYVSFLEAVLCDLREKDLTYSQANFAVDLGLSRPRVSQILKRKEGVSVKRAKDLAGALDLSGLEESYFLNLISSKTSKSKLQREESLDYVLKNYQAGRINYLPVSSWSLLDLVGWDLVWSLIAIDADFRDLKVIAKLSNITPSEVEAILEKMIELDLIKKSGSKYIKLKKHIAFGNSISKQSIRNHHKVKTISALRAIDHQARDTRINESMTFTMKKSDFSILRLKIESFLDHFLNEIETQDHDEISTINVCMFSALNKEDVQKVGEYE